MASITPTPAALIPCFRNSGAAIPQTERVKVFGITGVDGVGVHLLGKFGQPVRWEVKQFGTVAFLVTWLDDIAAAQGVISIFVSDEGTVYPNQLVEVISQPQKQTAVDGAGSEQIWTVQIQTRTV